MNLIWLGSSSRRRRALPRLLLAAARDHGRPRGDAGQGRGDRRRTRRQGPGGLQRRIRRRSSSTSGGRHDRIDPLHRSPSSSTSAPSSSTSSSLFARRGSWARAGFILAVRRVLASTRPPSS
ncbi:MAG: hypothetical protein M0C28_45445 [Candidatus Moduliflexus flocculans]|nr:hypothetical protein [Candidatus Moduliflexus flocculans]